MEHNYQTTTFFRTGRGGKQEPVGGSVCIERGFIPKFQNALAVTLHYSTNLSYFLYLFVLISLFSVTRRQLQLTPSTTYTPRRVCLRLPSGPTNSHDMTSTSKSSLRHRESPLI